MDASIAVGLLVENWSAYPLSKPTIEIQEGKVLQENTSIPVPGSVKAGTMNAGIILQSKVKSIYNLSFYLLLRKIFRESIKNSILENRFIKEK